MNLPDANLYQNFLNAAFPESVLLIKYQSVGGGCINNAVKLGTEKGSYFLKWNKDSLGDLFVTEARGLRLLFSAQEICIPKVIFEGQWEDKKFILLEFIEKGTPKSHFWEDFGNKLALLHKNHSHVQYGLDHCNFIGSLPQYNHFMSGWVNFFIEHRLEYQLKIAINKQLVNQQFANRYRSFYKLLADLLPEGSPSLLHGDLWSGNYMVGHDGLVCLIDPAVYYGNREIEISFTKMFGGFDKQFYNSYQDTYPLEKGFDQRIDIYNIYPSMVHVNLFGTSYLSGVERVLRKYI